MIFTKQLTLENPVIFESNKERIIHINTISLESSDDSKFPLEIFCENKRKKENFKICSLKKGANEIYSTNFNLDLHNFKDKYVIKLQTKAKNAKVNIIGFYEEEENEEKEHLKKNESKQNEKKYEIKTKKKNEKTEKEIKNKGEEKMKEINKKEENEEVKEKEDENIIELKNKNKEEKINEKNSEDDSNSESDSESDDNENEILEDNGPNVSLVDLLNKKRKEEPQDLKPMTLKNLSSPSEGKNAKVENKKKKIDNNSKNEKKKEIKKES